MKILLLHTADCHAWQAAEIELEKALKEVGKPVAYEVILVDSQELAVKNKFLGSPTIQIEGKDVDPAADKITNFTVEACRPYFWQGKSFDFPPAEMIIAALRSQKS